MKCLGLDYESRTRNESYEILLPHKVYISKIQYKDLKTGLWANLGVGGFLPPDFVLGHVQSEIVDEVLTASSRQKMRIAGISYPARCFKNVSHAKSVKALTATPEEDTVVAEWSQGDQPYRSTFAGVPVQDDHRFWDPLNHIKVNHGFTCIKHGVTNLELSEGFKRLEPTIKSKVDFVSIPNFLLELGDLRRLGDLFSTKYKNISHATGDKFLGVNFGVLPIVGDIKKMLTLAKRIDDYVDRWNDLAEKQSIITFKTTLFDYTTDKSIDESVSINEYAFRATCHSRAVLHVYMIPKKLPTSVRTSAKMRALGFDNPAGVIWEAIPFSFVVDWFANFSDLFDPRQKSLFMYDIVDAGYSIVNKTTVDVQYTTLLTSGINNLRSEVVSLPYQESESEYGRVKLDPKFFDGIRHSESDDWSLEVSMFSPHQAALGAALLAK